MSPSALTVSIPQPPICFLSGSACSGCLLLGSVCLAFASVPVYLSVDVSGVVMFPRMGVSISSTCVMDLGWFALKPFRMNRLVQVLAWMPDQLCGLHLTFKELGVFCSSGCISWVLPILDFPFCVQLFYSCQREVCVSFDCVSPVSIDSVECHVCVLARFKVCYLLPFVCTCFVHMSFVHHTHADAYGDQKRASDHRSWS